MLLSTFGMTVMRGEYMRDRHLRLLPTLSHNGMDSSDPYAQHRVDFYIVTMTVMPVGVPSPLILECL